MRKQCKLLNVARSTVSYQAVPEDLEDSRLNILQDARQIAPMIGHFWAQ